MSVSNAPESSGGVERLISGNAEIIFLTFNSIEEEVSRYAKEPLFCISPKPLLRLKIDIIDIIIVILVLIEIFLYKLIERINRVILKVMFD